MSLKDARQRRDEARSLLAAGVDPSATRKAMKAGRVSHTANSFEVVTREWFQKFSADWAPNHADRVIRLFERDLFPWLGSRAIAEIDAPELLVALRRIESRGATDTAHRALSSCGQVFRYAIATSRINRDCSRDLLGALGPIRGRHFAAVTDPSRLSEVLRAMDGYQGTLIVRVALRLAPMLFVRPGELRTARWKDVDLKAAEWRYQVTKTEVPHIVPLATQAVASLGELLPLTGDGPYIFPSARTMQRPMSDNALLAAMRRMGIEKDEMSGHGFRATARTVLDEVLGFRADFIEHQLAHAVRDPNGRAYNRTAFLPERRQMMQRWADYLDELRSSNRKEETRRN